MGNPKGTTAPVAHTHSSSQMSDGSASPREEEPQFGITPTDFELEADDPNGCMSPNAGKSEARNSSITNGAGAEVPSLRKVVDPSDYNINDIMEEDASRLWLKNLPRPWRALVTRPLNETEIEDMRVRAQITSAQPVEGRRPKLVLELGCAGAGKSSRVSECYERFGVEKLNLVLADGDLVRESHTELNSILNINRGELLDRLQKEGHSSLFKVYSEQTKSVPDSMLVGFQDCGEWCYSSSAGMKEQLAREALVSRKDFLLALTAAKTHYVQIIKEAVDAGYEVHVAAFCVQPSTLLTRQVNRAHSTGRLPTIDSMITDGNLYWNTVLKQQKVIQGIPALLDVAYKTGGTAVVFNNTPDFHIEPELPPIYEFGGYGKPRCRFPGKATLEGLIKHLLVNIQKTPPYIQLVKPGTIEISKEL